MLHCHVDPISHPFTIIYASLGTGAAGFSLIAPLGYSLQAAVETSGVLESSRPSSRFMQTWSVL